MSKYSEMMARRKKEGTMGLMEAIGGAKERAIARRTAREKEAAKTPAQKKAETNARIAPVGKVHIIETPKKRKPNMKAGSTE